MSLAKLSPATTVIKLRAKLIPVLGLASLMLSTVPLAAAQEGTTARTELRVCQDPDNLPFSNEREEGFENRIAELFGEHLGLPVKYFNYPQRFVFIRNTLRYKLPGKDYPCDVIIGLPVGFDQTAVTKGYYRSTYAMVFPPGNGLDDVSSTEDFLALDPQKLASLRIGLYDKSPVSRWMDRHNLVPQGVPYQTINMDMDHYTGDIIDKDLASGKIDVAIVWGPVAGYFANRMDPPMRVVLMKSEPGVKFDFEFGMGLRYGEPEWRGEIESFLDSHEGQIQEVLKAYHVPLINEALEPIRDDPN